MRTRSLTWGCFSDRYKNVLLRSAGLTLRRCLPPWFRIGSVSLAWLAFFSSQFYTLVHALPAGNDGKSMCIADSRKLTGGGAGAVWPSTAESSTLQTGAQSTTLQTGTQSTTLQTGTQSTTLQTGTQSTTLQTGTQSTTLQTGTQSTTLQTGTESALIQGGVERMGGPVNILIVLDCSYSMKEKLGGQVQKLEAAKQVLQNALARIPSDVNLGLRVFGQGSAYGAFSLPNGIDCLQTALLVPLGQGNRRSIIEKVRNLKPFGMTPLEYSLRQAAQDDFAGAEGSKTILLITDGADTCGGDPCRFIRMLPSLGIKMKVDVVGLDLKRDHSARAQLNCITENSGGKYYDVNTAAELIESISNSVNKAISGRVLPKAGMPAKNIETPPELQQIQPLIGH